MIDVKQITPRLGIALTLFSISIWMAWPMLTFQHYPHLTRREVYAWIPMIAAHVVMKRRSPR